MEVLVMNRQERQRKALCEMIKQRRITITPGAKQCELSYRQMLRVYKITEYCKPSLHLL